MGVEGWRGGGGGRIPFPVVLPTSLWSQHRASLLQPQEQPPSPSTHTHPAPTHTPASAAEEVGVEGRGLDRGRAPPRWLEGAGHTLGLGPRRSVTPFFLARLLPGIVAVEWHQATKTSHKKGIESSLFVRVFKAFTKTCRGLCAVKGGLRTAPGWDPLLCLVETTTSLSQCDTRMSEVM